MLNYKEIMMIILEKDIKGNILDLGGGGEGIISSIYGLDSQTYGKDIHQYYSRWLEGIRTILQYTREKNII